MDNYTLLINREHPLPKNYVPDNLISPDIPFDAPPGDEKRLLQKNAARAAEQLFRAGRREGLELFGISGYRSYARQTQLFTGSPDVALPGCSEHQSGLALDVSSPSNRLLLTTDFAETAEGCWLAGNASLYGFLLRYPKNKETLTGIPWEPWHIRYVGKALASCLALTGMVLEEYYNLKM